MSTYALKSSGSTPTSRKVRLAPAPTGSAKLVRSLLTVASYHVDRDDENGDMGKRFVHYLARVNGIAGDDPTDEALDLSLALGEVAKAGVDMLHDVYLIAGCRGRGVERREATASMAGTTAKHVRQVARALLLGADELERLATALDCSKGDD